MSAARPLRRLAAILSADIVGYSRMMGDDEAGTLAAVRSFRADILDPCTEEHGGRVVKTSGDGFLVEFASAVDAVEAGLAVQQQLAQSAIEFVLRIGINLGDVVIEDDDVFGEGVNVAARLEAIAEPGRIYLSSNVFEHVDGKIDASFEDLGPQALKNIERPVHVYATVDTTPEPDASQDGPSPAGSGLPVIAILPLSNMSSEAEDEYFSDGLTEDIITELSRFRDLRVISRNSTFQYKGQAVDVGQIGRDLNADYVVEGSIRRAGQRLRITAQLIETATGTHLWAERYDRSMEDVFAVQDELTQTIAATLGARLQDAALEQTLAKSTTDLGAYDCVLRARRFQNTVDQEHHAEARDLLEKAIDLDPNYADAFALLSNVYLAEHRFEFNPLPDSIGRAMEMAQTAIRLDPQNSIAHCWLAIVHFFRRENERFTAEANRALALNPNDPETLANIGHYYAYMGQTEYGCNLTRKAIALNPLHPGWYHFSFARLHYVQSDYADVVADIEKIDMPHFYWTWILLIAALGQLGETRRAADAITRMSELRPNFDARAELLKWNTPYDDLEHLVEGMRKAGMEIAD